MSWQEPCVQSFPERCHCTCTAVAACAHDRDWYKSWLFASTLPSFETLGSVCTHPPGSHQDIAGRLDPSGQFVSRLTAEYPKSLCGAIAQILSPLVSHDSHDFSLQQLDSLVPKKAVEAPPFARQDGGGFASQADWSSFHTPEDSFQQLRSNWMNHAVTHRLHKKVEASIAAGHDGPPLSDADLLPLQNMLVAFLESQGQMVDWTISPDQPMHLHILHAMSRHMNDPDVAIFPYLFGGVPIGIDTTIVPSHCFPLVETTDSDDNTLLFYSSLQLAISRE